jgi:hypothetical protein
MSRGRGWIDSLGPELEFLKPAARPAVARRDRTGDFLAPAGILAGSAAADERVGLAGEVVGHTGTVRELGSGGMGSVDGGTRGWPHPPWRSNCRTG